MKCRIKCLTILYCICDTEPHVKVTKNSRIKKVISVNPTCLFQGKKHNFSFNQKGANEVSIPFFHLHCSLFTVLGLFLFSHYFSIITHRLGVIPQKVIGFGISCSKIKADPKCQLCYKSQIN